LTLFSFLDHKDLWYDLCFSVAEASFPSWLRELVRKKEPFRYHYPLLADLSFIQLKHSANGHQLWEIHPAIQVVARQRAIADEQEYVRCAVSLVAAKVPRSYEENFWETMRRLEPHAEQCWRYIRQGKWGSSTNLTELESLGRLFRHVGRYEQASLIYRMIEKSLTLQTLTVPKAEFLADVFNNLGLVYTSQRKFDLSLRLFDMSSHMRSELGTFTPDASMSMRYNKAVVFMMTGKLDEAEEYLRNAAAHFARHETDQHGLMNNERKRLYARILNDLGEVLLRKGSAAAARDVFCRILGSQWERLGEFHPTVISIKLNLGRAHTKLGEFTVARSLLKEVIAIYTEWWGRRRLETMRAVDELALAFMEEGEHKKAAGMSADSEMQNAEALWKETLGFYQSTYGYDSDMVCGVKSNLQYLWSMKNGHT
jgi:tetratricopeptide (TPR) repeat protein